jgi:hypothetical protein
VWHLFLLFFRRKGLHGKFFSRVSSCPLRLFFGGGANEAIALSLRGGFIAETTSPKAEGIASVAIAPSAYHLLVNHHLFFTIHVLLFNRSS